MTTILASTKILVTGANGFIVLHTTLHLLQHGYSVRGTIRTEAHEKKVRETLSKQSNTSQLEFSGTDLLKDDGWMEAVHGCDFAIHIASPYPAEDPKDENELIIPAVEGTLRVLCAAR